ncbi:unnamed protein product [Sympodiomycopsis kandeliae]
MNQSYNSTRLGREEEGPPLYDSRKLTPTTSKVSYSSESEAAWGDADVNNTKSTLRKACHYTTRTLKNVFRWLVDLHWNRDICLGLLGFLGLIALVGGLLALFIFAALTPAGPLPPELGSEQNPMFVQLVIKTAPTPSGPPGAVDASEQDLSLALLKLINGTLMMSSSHQAAH